MRSGEGALSDPVRERQPSAADPEFSVACRVLIADDNVDAAESLAMLIDSMGSKARVVHNGLAAVEAVEEFKPDVVFLDMGMPGLDGYQACAQIKAMPWATDVVLVALTGWGQEQDRVSSKAAGFSKHLVKPVSIDDMKAAIFERRPGARH